jgi:hypothetical protein
MMGNMGKGLLGGFGLGALADKKLQSKKSNQRLLMGMSVGMSNGNEDRVPNVDPHLILGQIL